MHFKTPVRAPRLWFTLLLCALPSVAACGSKSESSDEQPGAERDENGLDPSSDEPAQVNGSPARDAGATSDELPTEDPLGSEPEPPLTTDAGSPGPSPTLLDAGSGLPKGTSIVTEADGGFAVLCGSHECACSDGRDNDGDSLSDGADSECTGPFDDDEQSFATGIPGDNRDPKWQDCFFDGNSGAGDDDCRYATECLTGDLPADDRNCQVSDACLDFCRPMTPPGCDCFGCCEFQTEAGSLHVRIDATCSTDKLDDPEACPRCEPATACDNPCGPCEICIGQTAADLPESCWPSEPPPVGEGGGGNTGEGGAGGSLTPPTGAGGSGGSGDSPPDSDPPPNVCDFGTPCVTSADCSDTGYCALGCCRSGLPEVR